MKIIKYFFEAIIIYFFFFIIKTIGLKRSRNLFSVIFCKIGFFFRQKKIIQQNIYNILGKLDSSSEKKIISEMWSNYGKTFVEYIYLYEFKRQSSHIKIVNKEILDTIIKKNKPVIFISGHFANFELMSMELVKYGFNLATIYRPLNNFFLNPLMEHLRRKYVCNNQIKKGMAGIRHVMNYVNKNYSIALMMDQRVSEGIRVPFFKKEALTSTLPAQLAIKFGYDIVPIYISRENNDEFILEIEEPIQVQNRTNSEENKSSITLNLNKIIERMVRRNPSQWILTHNRWK